MSKKGKGKAHGKADEKGELIEQLKVQNEVLQERLEEEVGLAQKLRQIQVSKDDAVTTLQADAEKLQEVHERELGILYDDVRSRYSQQAYAIKTLELETSRLQDELQSASVLEQQNSYLNNALNALQSDVESRTEVHRNQMEQLQFEFSSLRYVLEKEHRRRLQDAVEEIKTRAYESLALETKDAIKSAADFRRQLEEASRGVQNILHRYNSLQDTHKAMKMDHEIAVRDSKLQAKRAVSMKRSVMEAQAQVRQLNEQLEKDEADAKEAVEMRKRMAELEHELHREREQKDIFKQQRDALLRDRNRGGRSKLQLRSLNGSAAQAHPLADLQQSATPPQDEDKAMQNVLSIWNANFSPTVADVRLQAIRRIAQTPIRKMRKGPSMDQADSHRLPDALRPATSSLPQRPGTSGFAPEMSVRPSTVGTAGGRPRPWSEMDRGELEMNVQAPYGKRKTSATQFGARSRHAVSTEVKVGRRTLPRFFVPF